MNSHYPNTSSTSSPVDFYKYKTPKLCERYSARGGRMIAFLGGDSIPKPQPLLPGPVFAGKIINENRTRRDAGRPLPIQEQGTLRFRRYCRSMKTTFHLKVCPSLSKIMSVSQCFPLHFPYTSVGPWCCMQSSAHKSYQCA